MRTEDEEVVLERVTLAGIMMTPEQEDDYLSRPHDMGKVDKGTTLPLGFKRCGRCGKAKKFFLYNKNNGSKTNTSGNCKVCQKETARASYGKTKKKRNYKKYYQENKEAKQAQARKYYQENKDVLKEKHKAYVQSAKGRTVMRRAHAKRRKTLAENAGVPYTRELVIRRDSEFLGLQLPVCYLCDKPIEDITGTGLHMDHVVPVLLGGLDCFTNIASTHASCNLTREKDARELLPEQIEAIAELAASYIDANPTEFEDA